MSASHYLVFGDLHGRILPAFKLAAAWQRDHGVRLGGLLQVGDLGYFPDPLRMDQATQRHAAKDPLELGAQLVAIPTKEADEVFADPDVAEALWFTVGNHEDYEALAGAEHGPDSTEVDFAVDYYGRVRCIRDAHVLSFPDGPRVAALWGIDDKARNHRTNVPRPGYITERSATHLSYDQFDVLLCHDSPRDAVYRDSGSEHISMILELVQPAFCFFGHYHSEGRLHECDFGKTQVFHMAGLTFRTRDGHAEAGSVGVLTWENGAGTFEYLPMAWLKTITRHNWRHR